MGNFPKILHVLKKFNCIAAKRQQDHHGRRHKSSNNTVKSGDTYKINSHTFHEEHNFKGTQGKKQGASHLQDFEKVSESGEGMEELNKMSNKKVKHHYNHSNNGCFKVLFSASKKKKLPARISSFEPQTNQLEGVEIESNLPKASLNTIPSLGRSRSINEQGTKTPHNFTTPSLNRTSSAGNKTTSRTLNISSSIGESTKAKFQRPSNGSKSGPIIFSNSSGVLKPPPSEEQLECTLEELCHGCVKRIKVSRSVYTFKGHIKQEDEILTVKIKPGWKTGTKITFTGTINDDRPGEILGDIIFVITEKLHPLFQRIEDDLELELEIPLVDALTGCNLTIPLLGNEKMSLEINEIIHPGQEKIIVGQGMPNQKNPNQKGDLKVKFLVRCPNNLSDEQRSEISRILSD